MLVHRRLTAKVLLRVPVHVHHPRSLHTGTMTTSSTTKVHMVTNLRRDTMTPARYWRQNTIRYFCARNMYLIKLIFNCRVVVPHSMFSKCQWLNLLGIRSHTCRTTIPLPVGNVGLRKFLACHNLEMLHFPLRTTSRYVHSPSSK